jgi:hypothetical protein
MINLLILFDTEFKVSDFFFPDIAFVRMYMDGAGMILFHSSRGFLGFVCFFFYCGVVGFVFCPDYIFGSLSSFVKLSGLKKKTIICIFDKIYFILKCNCRN